VIYSIEMGDKSRAVTAACVEVLQMVIAHPEYTDRVCRGLGELLTELQSIDPSAHPSGAAPNEPSDTSEAQQAIMNQFSADIGIRELKTIAAVVAERAGIHLPTRAQNRKKHLLYHWFNENWDQVKEILPYVKVRNERDSRGEHSQQSDL
jgi:hypothetical protein